MINLNDPNDLSEWLKREFAKWRKILDAGGTLPKTVGQLLLHSLEAHHRPIVMSEDDENMLTLVVNDALQNVDIEKRYPAFYLKLLNNSELRQAFLDALELLEVDKANRLIEPPKIATQKLPFLQPAAEPPPQPFVVKTAANRWRASWHLLQTQLDQLFAPPEPAYRSSFDLDEEGTILLRSQFEAAGKEFDMFLEAVKRPDEPSQLYLYLSTAMLGGGIYPETPMLNARLAWGETTQTVDIDRYGRAQFEPIPVQTLMNPEDQTFAADLQLTVEAEV